jgi:hypothetical protein
MRINGWLVALTFCAGTSALPAPTLACGCTPVIDRRLLTPLAEVQEQLVWADQVFLGRVANRTVEAITLSVEAYWKGSGASTQTLLGDRGLSDGTVVISDCDFSFAIDSSYVVFAHRTPRGLGASSCSMTRQLDQAGGLIQLLDRAAPRQAVRLVLHEPGPPNVVAADSGPRDERE